MFKSVARSVEPWKNSTFATVPSESAAVACSVMVFEVVKLEPFAGLVMDTVGAALVTVRVAVLLVTELTEFVMTQVN